jgi:uncharacterized repeat protein (TIGR03803 family)
LNREGGSVHRCGGKHLRTTTAGGEYRDGTVFEISNTGNYSQFSFYYPTPDYPEGADPEAGVIGDAAGNLYGTTAGGGGYGAGTVFELVKNSGGYTLSTLLSFNGSNGSSPKAPLIADAAGNLFGTTEDGGTNGKGTVFEFVKNSEGYTFAPLVSFDGGNGAYPTAGLIVDAAGDLFGTTFQGGANDCGTVFEVRR